MEWITDSNPIRTINTVEVKLSTTEAYKLAEQGILNAFKGTSNPCLTKILSEVRKSINQMGNKPHFNV